MSYSVIFVNFLAKPNDPLSRPVGREPAEKPLGLTEEHVPF